MASLSVSVPTMMVHDGPSWSIMMESLHELKRFLGGSPGALPGGGCSREVLQGNTLKSVFAGVPLEVGISMENMQSSDPKG